MKKLFFILSASVVLLLVFPGCGNIFAPGDMSPTDASSVSRVVTSSEYYDPAGTILKTETGVLGPGADYRIDLPPGWQGFPEGQKNLLIYAHGYVTQGLDFKDTEEYKMVTGAIDLVVGTGFAVAYSSYAESGWAVKSGVIRTRQLRGYFVDKFGKPDHIFLLGISEGALIVIKLAEQNPDLFSGVLAFAGPIGGAELEFAHILNTRMAFDYFYKDKLKLAAVSGIPNAANLAGALGYNLADLTGNSDDSAVNVHPDLLPVTYVDSTPFIGAMGKLIAGFLMANPVKAMEMASVMVDGVNLFPAADWQTNPAFIPEFAYTIATALWYNIYGTDDLFIKTHGAMPLDNNECVYEYYPYGPDNDFEVERFTARPSAGKYLEHWYKPDGDLTIPVVTLHITRDPAVPFRHEKAYGAEAGNSPFLTQKPLVGFGHGTLMTFDEYGIPHPDQAKTLGEILGAFNTLVAQVTGQTVP